MNKEFVKYEEALALKELGFDDECFGEYRQWDECSPWLEYEFEMEFTDTKYTVECKAPLYQQAFRFFREKYDMFSHLDKNAYSKYYYDIHNRGEIFFDEEYFNTPEEAELECLKKLIDFVNQNKEDE